MVKGGRCEGVCEVLIAREGGGGRCEGSSG